ncbi:3-oxoacyl-[acyl-carrier-protein] synthase III C-terminal domain-containing protein [Streptomyces sp. NPDC008001]|uniref:3-oxoacyl-[acyl-carrier-protein] synthase III C-terminal domain-containing protein n=1 Tax=Streptomyces sp. NPDC008001 TaxID=3364804 RepID=UPI0036EB6E60
MNTLPITLAAVDSFLPRTESTIDEVLDDHGLSAAQIRVFRRVHGLDKLRLDPGLGLFDLLLPAARSVLAGVAPERVRFIIYTHALQQVTPVGIDAAQVLASALGLPHADAFALTQHNCAQALTGMDLAGELLRAEGAEGDCALIISGDRVFTPLIQLDYALGQLLADGAAACLVSLGGPGDVIRSHAARSDDESSGAPARQAGVVGPELLAETMCRAVADAGLDLADIDLVIPHNVNMTFWRQTAKVLGIPREKIFLENIARYSHCFSADPLINYRTLADAGRLVAGGNYLMAAVGVGGSYGATVLSRPSSHPQRRSIQPPPRPAPQPRPDSAGDN